MVPLRRPCAEFFEILQWGNRKRIVPAQCRAGFQPAGFAGILPAVHAHRLGGWKPPEPAGRDAYPTPRGGREFHASNPAGLAAAKLVEAIIYVFFVFLCGY
jgi:hypothetical protein